MQVVIDIDEDTYEILKKYGSFGRISENAILNGTPLPKEHGNLIDADAVLEEVHRCLEERDYTLGTLYDNLCELPTIIEADTEYEVWNGFNRQIVAPKGTFEKIWQEADKGDKNESNHRN